MRETAALSSILQSSHEHSEPRDHRNVWQRGLRYVCSYFNCTWNWISFTLLLLIIEGRKMIKREDSHIASCSSPHTRGGTVNARHHPLLLIITRSTNTNEPPAHPVPEWTSQGSAMWKFYLPLSPASSNIIISRWSLSPLAFSTCVGNEENIYCWRCSTFISNFHTDVATFLHVPSNVKSLRGNYVPLFENVEYPLGTCWMF